MPPKKKKVPVTAGKREIIGTMFLGLALLLILGLFTYKPGDVSAVQMPANEHTMNMVGLFGAWSAFLVLQTLGVAGYLLPVVLAILGILVMMGDAFQPEMKPSHKAGWLFVVLIAIACMMETMEGALEGLMASKSLPFAGGIFGYLLGNRLLMQLMGPVGTPIVLALVVLMAAVCLFDFPISTWLRSPRVALLKLKAAFQVLMAPAESSAEEDSFTLEEDRVPVEAPRRKPRRKKVKADDQAEEPLVAIEQDIVCDRRSPGCRLVRALDL